MWRRRNQPDEPRPSSTDKRARILAERQREYARELAEQDRRRAEHSIPPPRKAA
jgi:hypothetical protein